MTRPLTPEEEAMVRGCDEQDFASDSEPMRLWATLDAERQKVRVLREALAVTLRHYDRNTCQHDETHRAGAIWTICDQCGRKWADDEGGFEPYADPPGIERARTALATTEPKP